MVFADDELGELDGDAGLVEDPLLQRTLAAVGEAKFGMILDCTRGLVANEGYEGPIYLDKGPLLPGDPLLRRTLERAAAVKKKADQAVVAAADAKTTVEATEIREMLSEALAAANAAKAAAIAAADKSLADAVAVQDVANRSVATFEMIWEYARGLAVTSYSGPHCQLCSEKYVNGSGMCFCNLINELQ